MAESTPDELEGELERRVANEVVELFTQLGVDDEQIASVLTGMLIHHISRTIEDEHIEDMTAMVCTTIMQGVAQNVVDSGERTIH